MFLFDLIFILFGIFMWVAAIVLIHYRRKTLGKTALMREVETSAAADAPKLAPGTPVEVKGTLRCESPLESERSGRTCAYYLSQVIRESEERRRDADGDMRTHRHREVVTSNERFAPFVVEDDSGAVDVRGEGAEVDALEVMNRFEQNTGDGVTIGGITLSVGSGKRTVGYRYVESILPVDAPVYVLGTVREGGGIEAPAQEEKGFLISHRSEEHLNEKYRRHALLLGLVAAALFLFGTAFVAIGGIVSLIVVVAGVA